jgi:hypothetical protein
VVAFLIFLYLICHDFQKIIGRIKFFDKCTSDAVAHGVRLLPPHPRREVPAAVGSGDRSQIPAPTLLARRQKPAAERHGDRPLTPCHTAARFFLVFGFLV